MHRPQRLLPLAVATLAILTGVLAATSAGSTAAAAAWTRIGSPNTGGVQLGLARTSDGTLHVIWNRGNQAPSSIFDTRFSSSGAKRSTTTVTGSWDGSKNGLALLVMPDKTLRLFVTGDRASSSSGGVNSFTAPATGAGWSLQPESWGGPVAEASGLIGATLTKDGQVVTGWRGFAAEGIPPSSIPQNPYAPFQLGTHLATDATSGAVVLAGVYGGGKGGVWVQQIVPAPSKSVILSDSTYNNDWIDGLSARIGAPGVYVAYVDTKTARLYRYGGASRTLARGAFTSATVCAGPDGRLWLAWGDARDGLFVTRTSRAAGALEPVQKLKIPSSNGLTFLQCEGSGGPLDLFADDGTGFWHTHVLARFAVHAAVARTKRGAKVTVSVRDAGDPVAGAAVTIGGRHLRTGSNGSVALSLRSGAYSATAVAAGYASASTSFHV